MLAMSTGQTSENDRAVTAIVCAPSTLSKMMGSLHPAGALYEKPVNTSLARASHDAFVARLRQNGIEVYDVRDILTNKIAWSVGDRIALENLAFNCLKYVFDRGDATTSPLLLTKSSKNGNTVSKTVQVACSKSTDAGTDPEKYYVSNSYKQLVIEEMGEQQLVDVIFTNPTVTICPSDRDTGFTASYKFEPLTNITFVRDQQITTREGIVMGRLRSSQRAREVDIMLHCLQKVGLKVIGHIPAPGYLEGGDFFPADEEFCLLGIGPRSNWEAASYLMSNDLFGTGTVAVVKDELDQNQNRMHLDTVFNIIDKKVCIMLDTIMGANSPTRRLVDEYVRCESLTGDKRNTDSSHIGRYMLHKQDVEFEQYMREKGFRIIKISATQQLNYGCNVLNIGSGRIIMAEREAARIVATSPHFTGTVQLLDFRGVTCMYGGLHCASQVVLRQSKEKSSN